MFPEIATFETQELKMRYFRFGTKGKRPLVILSGLCLGSVADSARAVAAAYRLFREEFDVYVPDRRSDPPLGYTVRDMAQDTAAFLSSLDLPPADLLGISQGGMVAQLLASLYAPQVHAAALASTTARITPEEALSFEKWKHYAQNNDVLGLLTAFAELIYTPRFYQRLSAVLGMSAETITPEDLRWFTVYVDAMRGFDALELLPGVTCPTMVFAGSEDRLMRPDAADELSSALGCPCRLYSGYGHAVYDESQAFRRDVLIFFRSLE